MLTRGYHLKMILIFKGVVRLKNIDKAFAG
jgi:hypothetical protein